MMNTIILFVLLLAFCTCHKFTSTDFQFFLNRTVACTPLSSLGLSDGKTLIHLPTSEGLLSHVYQLQTLWSLSRAIHINKTIVEVPFRSHHFPGEIVTVCDILQFPSDLVCSCETVQQVGNKQKHCPMLGFDVNWATHANAYGMNNSQTEIGKNVNLLNETCVAGMLYSLQYMPRYKAIMNSKTNPPARFPFRFNAAYLKLSEMIRSMDLLPLDVALQTEIPDVDSSTTVKSLRNQFVAVHWRRDDQLYTRCIGKGKIKADHSINCGTVEEFVSFVHASLHASSISVVYIATNEKNSTALDIIQYTVLGT